MQEESEFEMNLSIMSNVPVYAATCRSKQIEVLRRKLAGELPDHPQPTSILDENQDSPTFLQQIPVDPGSYITSAPGGGNGPVWVTGRVCLANAKHTAEALV